MTNATQKLGRRLYEKDRDAMLANPELAELYREEGANKELWLQLMEAREAVGLSQPQLARRLGVSRSQVARWEKIGFDVCTLAELRRYVEALGGNFVLEVKIYPVGNSATSLETRGQALYNRHT